jgi:hypothetical protein
MGLFDFFSKTTPESVIQKHAPRIASKRTQNPDRWDSIQAVGKLRSAAAVEALLPRFTFYVDPSITDGEEKDEAFRYVVETGEGAIAPVLAFMAKAESLAWPLKILERVASPERVVEELLALLAKMGTEYERDPSRKLAILSTLEERADPRIVLAVLPFVADANDEARFFAVGALARQADPSPAQAALETLLLAEESVRTKARTLELFAAQGWALGDAARAAVQKALPAGFVLGADGVPKRRG